MGNRYQADPVVDIPHVLGVMREEIEVYEMDYDAAWEPITDINEDCAIYREVLMAELFSPDWAIRTWPAHALARIGHDGDGAVARAIRDSIMTVDDQVQQHNLDRTFNLSREWSCDAAVESLSLAPAHLSTSEEGVVDECLRHVTPDRCRSRWARRRIRLVLFRRRIRHWLKSQYSGFSNVGVACVLVLRSCDPGRKNPSSDARRMAD